MKIMKYVLFLVMAFFLGACSKPKSASDLVGNYEADYDVAREKVTLNNDNTFVQEVTLKSTGKVDVAKGTFTYYPRTGYVTFNENYMIVIDGFRKLNPDYVHPQPGLVSLPADTYFGRIYIGVSEGVLYKKFDSGNP